MIRKACIDDALHIADLIHYEAQHTKILPRALEEIKSVIDCFYVWEEGDQLLGICSLEVYSPKLAEIRSLVVQPGHRRKGIGQKLIEACVNEAKKKRIYEVLAVTDRVSFFQSVGFHVCLNGQFAMFMKNN